jgi:hypothetical protein
MNRLHHSPEGFIKLLQMSRYAIFAFVEGHVDRYFYGRVCEIGLQGRQEGYFVYRSSELPWQGGGKNTLLQFFSFARDRGFLCSDFQNKRTGLVFFLDKDIDDLVGTQVVNDHLIYTRYYELENHLFRSGKVTEACAGSACLDLGLVRNEMGNETDWIVGAARQWKEWTMLCYFAKKQNINCTCNYGSNSDINIGQNGEVDMAAYRNHVAELELGSSVSREEFQALLRAIGAEVDGYYASSQWDRIFRGKWYAACLQGQVKRIARVHEITPIHVNIDTFTRALAASVDYSAQWVGLFLQPFRQFLRCFA